MSERVGFLKAICADPADDTVRLVYADWLEEHGGEPERAEFIRVQVALAADPRCVLAGQGMIDCGGTCPACKLRKRSKEFLEYHAHEWFAAPPVHVPSPAYFAQWWRDVARGFREKISCTADDWFAHGDVIRDMHPITSVRLTTAPTLQMLEHVTRELTRDQLRTILYDGPYEAASVFEARWPGITFTLPEA